MKNKTYLLTSILILLVVLASPCSCAAAPIPAAQVATPNPPSKPMPPPQSTQTLKPPAGPVPNDSGAAFNIDQAISDGAQLDTVAFSALAFFTGDFNADTFFPPGKVADFWGFQYLRDNDPSHMGHNTDFLTDAAYNMLHILTPGQCAELISLGQSQVGPINQYAINRFVLIVAFRRLANGDLPAGTTGLSEAAVQAYSEKLYNLDGEITLQRVTVMANILNSLNASQKAYLNGMVGKGMTAWPKVDPPSILRGLSNDVNVNVMTYAGDMFSWYTGSIEADTYFNPERQGTYFGSFYLKDAPAVNNPGYTISSSLTADMGATLLNSLSPDQAKLISDIIEMDKPDLLGIVTTRRSIATNLRGALANKSPDSATVLGLMDNYGKMDGSLNYNIATHFARIYQSLTSAEKMQLMALRTKMIGNLVPAKPFLYAEPISMPQIPNTDFLFK